MKRRSRPVEQFFGHDIEDEEKAQAYLADALPLIGFIVMEFNALESDVNSTVCGYISDRTDEKGLLVLHRMGYSAKVDLFERFSDDYHRAAALVVAEHVGLVSKLREAGTLRNMVVHADWESTEDDGYTFVRVNVTKSGLEQEYVQFSKESLGEILATIRTARKSLDDYRMAVDDAEMEKLQASEFERPLVPRS